jgi:hypothetical protein
LLNDGVLSMYGVACPPPPPPAPVYAVLTVPIVVAPAANALADDDLFASLMLASLDARGS